MIALSKVDPLNGIPNSSLIDLKNQCVIKQFSKGSFIYKPEDPVANVFVVLTGKFISYRLTHCGKMCTLSIFSAGEFIGEEDLLYSNVRDSFVESIGDSKCILIPRRDYLNLLNSNPKFSLIRFKNICKRMKETEQMKQEIAYSTVSKRLILILRELGNQIGKNTNDEIELCLDMSHKILASMIGSTRETVTSTLSLLQREGTLKVDGKKVWIRKEKIDKYL